MKKPPKSNRGESRNEEPVDPEADFPETISFDQTIGAFYEAQPEFRTQSAGDYIPPFVPALKMPSEYFTS